jgi:hypothetical protein
LEAVAQLSDAIFLSRRALEQREPTTANGRFLEGQFSG